MIFSTNNQNNIDVLVNIEKEQAASLKNNDIFLIYYRQDLKKFFIETIKENVEIFFIFIHLNKPQMITNEVQVFSVMNYVFKIKADKKMIFIEYGTAGNMNNVQFDNSKKTIFVGRKQGSDIEINDDQFSREQFMLFFEENNWFIKDGGNGKGSANGTWLFVKNKYEINDSIVFKVGKSLMNLEKINK